jgi:hypothetical protein
LHGGRWNPPRSFPTLYLNEDIDTARSQIRSMLEGSPVDPEDLDGGYVLVAATLPSNQVVADAVSGAGLEAIGLPVTYPVYRNGRRVGHGVCQAVGADIEESGLRGVRARSATTRDGAGREVAWFPARRSSVATPVGEPLPFQDWWNTPPVFDD